MRAIDIDLRKALEFRPERGQLLLGGERMFLLNRGTLRTLYGQLRRDLGEKASQSFLLQLGFAWGQSDHRALAGDDWDSEHDRLTAGPVRQMWQGIVHVEATTVDFDRAAGRFLMRGMWRNSYEVDLNRELGAESPLATAQRCLCLAGYASGWATAFFGQPLLAVETACASQGAPHCTFEIRPEAAFGAEADPFRPALRPAERPAAPGATPAKLGAAPAEGVAHASVGAQSGGVAQLDGPGFISNLSHELRTPAAAIIGLAESLGKSGLNPAQKRSVNLLRESAETLVTIVEDLLNLSEIEAKHVEIERAPLDLRELVDSVAAQVEPRAREKGLTFFVTAHDGFVPQITGDGPRLRQVLLHLMTNAVRSTDAGAVVVTLRAGEPVGAGSSRFGIDVVDTGTGIPGDRLATLFDAFPGLAAGATGRSGGSGCGLAISRRLARLMGGDIEVETQIGSGSTFRFTFVAGTAQAASPALAVASRTAPETDGPLRVLIVEDNPVLLFLLREQLSTLGHQPVACTGGADALKELGRQTFDLVFTDLHMPQMDGFEFNRKLRALGLAAQPYMIALTADATPRQRARCLAEGMDDFAIKPLSQEGLVELLARVSAALAAPKTAEAELVEVPAAAEPIPALPSPIDEAALTALRTNLGSDELLFDLIGTFIRDANELVGLFASSDGVEARRAAHSLKSTAMAVGAKSLSSIAAEAEKGQPSAAIPRARTELGRVEQALRAMGF